jgi:hypothetical protein
MNHQQRIASFSALSLFALSILAAPWEMTVSSGNQTGNLGTRYSPVWSPPIPEDPNVRFVSATNLRISMLITEWVAIGVLFCGVFILLKGSPKEAELNTEPLRIDQAERAQAAELARQRAAEERRERNHQGDLRMKEREDAAMQVDREREGSPSAGAWVFCCILGIVFVSLIIAIIATLK